MPRPTIPPVEKITALPEVHRVTIDESYLDAMGHMNVRWYLAIFDDASWQLIQSLGMTPDYYRENNAGGFALQHVITYLAEVRVGQTVSIHPRLIAYRPKRMHFMYFMVNRSTNALAATLEGVGAHADMTVRRTSPYPPHILQKIEATVAASNTLDWSPPLSGAIAL